MAVPKMLSMSMYLIDGNGVQWELATPMGVSAIEGMVGLGAPDPTLFWSSPPALDGSTLTGWRVAQREVQLPLYVEGRNSTDFMTTDAKLWSGLKIGMEVDLVVEMPNGTSRTLTMVRSAGADPELDSEPIQWGRQAYPLTFIAGDPYWRGNTITVRYEAPADLDFLPDGPNIILANSASYSTGQITNPGDVPAWPRWVINGPCTSYRVGVGNAVVGASVALVADERRIIDLRGGSRVVRKGDGTPKWDELTEWKPASIPAGQDVDLTMQISGGGPTTYIELSIDPRYERARSAP